MCTKLLINNWIEARTGRAAAMCVVRNSRAAALYNDTRGPTLEPNLINAPSVGQRSVSRTD